MNKKQLLSMTTKSIGGLILAFGISLSAQAQQGLIVRSSTGSTTSLSYANVAKLKFVNEVMTAVSPSGVEGQSFVLSTTAKFTFGEVATGLKDGLQNSNTVRLYPTLAISNITLQGATEGTQATIYSITGAKVMQFEVNSPLQDINVSNLNSGIYMLRANNQTFKFSKK